MMNGERKEGICRLNVDGNGCDYLRILSDLETKLRNNTNPKEKIELALQGALMFYGADRAYVIEVDDELGIGVNTYECCAPGIDVYKRQGGVYHSSDRRDHSQAS